MINVFAVLLCFVFIVSFGAQVAMSPFTLVRCSRLATAFIRFQLEKRITPSLPKGERGFGGWIARPCLRFRDTTRVSPTPMVCVPQFVGDTLVVSLKINDTPLINRNGIRGRKGHHYKDP
jgi:hypothetical protein